MMMQPVTIKFSQRGSVLMISLIILLLLTILGLSGMRTTIMEERMAGNMRDRNLAFQAAEAALREAEDFLRSATLPTFDGSNGLYQPAALSSDLLRNTINWSSSSAVSTYSDTISNVYSQPTYIIEELTSSALTTGGSLASDDPGSLSRYYRITARGVGASETAVVFLESVFRR